MSSYPNIGYKKVRVPIGYTKIDVTTDSSGNASVDSDVIDGEILKIAYSKGTVDSSTTVALTTKVEATNEPLNPIAETISTYEINSGAAVEYPRTADDYLFIVVGKLTATVSSGAHSKTFSIYVYVR